jgi:hypothetical protein
LPEKQRKRKNSLDFCPPIDYLIEKVARPVYVLLRTTMSPCVMGDIFFYADSGCRRHRGSVYKKERKGK